MINHLENIKYIVVDVDGTMTDAGIYYDEFGNELKKFCTKDAAGYFVAHEVGMEVIVLTGRECKAVTRRMEEMGIKHIYQNVKDKKEFMKGFIENNNIEKKELAYIGDDLNDYESMKLAGFIGCPKDSCEEILAIADYVAKKKGGHGAIREIISFILKQRGQWENTIKLVYGISEIR